MSTNTYDKNLAVAETYYHQMLDKNFSAMEQCLHPDVLKIQFHSAAC